MHSNTPQKRKKYSRLAELQADGTFPWTRTEVDRKVEAGEIPAPIPLGPNTLAWRAVDLEAWEAGKVLERDRRLAAKVAARAAAEASNEPPAPKRPPIRWRKDPVPATTPLPASESPPGKRGRGRPRKHPSPAAGPSPDTGQPADLPPIAAARR